MVPCHISYGDLLSGLSRLALRVVCGRYSGPKHRTSSGTLQPKTAQLPVIARREKAHEPGFGTIAAVSIKPGARSATLLNCGLSAVAANSCLTPFDPHRSPNFPHRNSPPLSDGTIITFEGTSPCTNIREELLDKFRCVRRVAHKIHSRMYAETNRRAL